MKKWFVLSLSSLIFSTPWGFSTSPEEFDRMLQELLKGIQAPLIRVSEIQNPNDYVFLDAREKEEFDVSHISQALHVGYENYEFSHADPEKKYVVYCSVGYRSGKIAEKLRKKGIQAFNLYGGIFEWKHHNKKLIDNDGKKTDRVHTFDKKWGKWLRSGKKVN